MSYDPWNGKQINFERTDRSGRYSPIIEEDDRDPWLVHVLGGAAAACLIAIGFAYAIGCSW